MDSTFGARLRAAREAADLTQTELAERLAAAVGPRYAPPAQETISRWERGLAPPERIQPVWRRALGAVLGVRVERFEAEEDDVLRRAFLATAAVTPAAAASSDRPGAIGTEHLAALRGSHEALITLDDSFGGGATIAVATDRLKLAKNWLDHGRYTAEVGRELWQLTGELHEATAWGLYDDGRHDEARAHFHEALAAAKAADSPPLEVMTLAAMALQQLYLKRPRQADALLTAAVAASNRTGGHRLTSLLAMRQADAAAQLGDRRTCMERISFASNELDRVAAAPREPWETWQAFYDRAELAANIAVCQSELGDHAQAVVSWKESLSLQSPSYVRNRGNYLAWLSEELVKSGDVEEAISTADAADLTLRLVASGRADARLRQARRTIAAVNSTAAKEAKARWGLT